MAPAYGLPLAMEACSRNLAVTLKPTRESELAFTARSGRDEESRNPVLASKQIIVEDSLRVFAAGEVYYEMHAANLSAVDLIT